jgi:hypothetical protein
LILDGALEGNTYAHVILATGVADSDFDRRLARCHGGKYKIADV